MIAGMLLLGIAAFMLMHKSDAQLRAAEAILRQRRTPRRVVKEVPIPDSGDQPDESSANDLFEDSDFDTLEAI